MTKLTIYSQPGLLVFVTREHLETELHHHHALQLIISMSTAFTLHSANECSLACEAALISSDTPHQIVGTECAIFLIDPESHIARILQDTYLQDTPFKVFQPEWLAECRHLLTSGLSQLNVERCLAYFAKEVCLQRHIEPRIKHIIDGIDDTFEKGLNETLDLKFILQKVHLSESRFLHLFVEQVGIPWRRFILWRRLLKAAQLSLAEGSSLTEAAISAGFSDAAHFSRTFRKMFGLNPAAVLKHSQFIQV